MATCQTRDDDNLEIFKMFGDVNRVEILGNVTNDLELRYTPNGAAVLNFGVATNRRYQQDNEWKDDTTFHNVVVWGKQAETMARFAKKGTRLYISGRLQTRSWEGEDGKKNYKTEIVAREISLLARYDKEGKSEAVAGESSKASSKGESSEEEINPEDLPF